MIFSKSARACNKGMARAARDMLLSGACATLTGEVGSMMRRFTFGKWVFRTMPALAAALVTVPASAHPHVWIDMTVSAMFAEDGNLTGFRHVWIFDEFYTVFQLEALEGREPDEEALEIFADDMIESISGFNYLMSITTGDGPALIAATYDEKLVLRPDQRLELAFTADLETPVNLREAPLRYAVFDPEYYIEMLHVPDTGTLMTGAPPETCTMEIARPAPTFEMLSLAAAVETMQEDAPPLGESFAEKVTIDCRPEDARRAS